MKALWWKQPYAHLMLHGKIETRTWHTNVRGQVLICASKVPYTDNELLRISKPKQYNRIKLITDIEEVMNGRAIAIGNLVHCRPMLPGDEDKCYVEYNPGLYCHVYQDVFPIEPFLYKGSQGFRDVPIEIENQIRIIT